MLPLLVFTISNPKQNARSLLTPVSGPAFQALSHGCLKILQQPIRISEISGYWSCHGEQNAGYHVKEHKKLGHKEVSKVTLRFVWGHLSKQQTLLHECVISLC